MVCTIKVSVITAVTMTTKQKPGFMPVVKLVMATGHAMLIHLHQNSLKTIGFKNTNI
jgi:hypothetical protein